MKEYLQGICAGLFVFALIIGSAWAGSHFGEKDRLAHRAELASDAEGYGTRIFSDAAEYKINIYLAHGWEIKEIRPSPGNDSYTLVKER